MIQIEYSIIGAMSTFDYTIVAAILAIIFAGGAFFYRWIGNPEDMQVAGRSVPPFILAATMAATNICLYNFVGYVGTAYEWGISVIWHEWTGMMALVFSGLFVLPLYRRLRISSIPEYLEARYHKGLRWLIGFLWVFRLAAWMGVLLYLAGVVMKEVTGLETVTFTLWVVILALLAIIYTFLGGQWAVIMTNTFQFLILLLAGLIVLPMALSKVDWLPGLIEKLPAANMALVPQKGDFNWLFIIAIWFCGMQWATTDQGLLQSALGAKDVKSVVKGLVYAGIIMTPIAYITVAPGLAASILHPGLENADAAMPTLMRGLLPLGVLGLVLAGLLVSQMSTISANLNACATLFTNDIYRTLLKRQPSPKAVIHFQRVIIIIAGVFMIGFSFLVPILGGAVDAYLTVIGIMDVPLFIVGIVYGFLWKRATWQGAIVGYLAGAAAGAVAKFGYGYPFGEAAFFSAGGALIVGCIVSLLTPPTEPEKIEKIWALRTVSEEEKQSKAGAYHIVPRSAGGKVSLIIFAVGLVMFLVGSFMGAAASKLAGSVALIGMIVYFAGGFLRLQFD
jgi:SSS family solute:Na+ symporter